MLIAPNSARSILKWQVSPCEQVEFVRASMGVCGLPRHFHDVWSVGLILQGSCSFRIATGLTPGAYLRQLRVQKSRHLIGQMPLADLASLQAVLAEWCRTTSPWVRRCYNQSDTTEANSANAMVRLNRRSADADESKCRAAVPNAAQAPIDGRQTMKNTPAKSHTLAK